VLENKTLRRYRHRCQIYLLARPLGHQKKPVAIKSFWLPLLGGVPANKKCFPGGAARHDDGVAGFHEAALALHARRLSDPRREHERERERIWVRRRKEEGVEVCRHGSTCFAIVEGEIPVRQLLFRQGTVAFSRSAVGMTSARAARERADSRDPTFRPS
jgi:hypothetical protein